MDAMIMRLFASEAAWRYIDAYFPRVFGLLFHTYLLRQYGGELYALPGWLLGMLGLFMAFLPDPHSYILIRAHRERAHRLLALTIPWLLIKVAACTGIAVVCMYALPTTHLTSAHGTTWSTVFAATALYGSVEFLWAVLGTTSLATGRVKRVALWGLFARFSAISLIALSWKIGASSMAEDFLLATSPVLLAWVFLSPWKGSVRRSWLFFRFSLRTYTGWNQGIALATNAMFQLPLLIIGIHPAVGASTVGLIAYIGRLLQAALQPFQILQSIVIKEAAQAARGVTSADPKRLKWIFQFGGVAIFGSGAAMLGASVLFGNSTWASSLLAMAMVAGVAFSTWNRYELAKVLSTPRLKELFIFGYLPVVSATLLLAILFLDFAGLFGLAIITFLGWIFISISWKWTK